MEQSHDFCFVYSTFPNQESAMKVARALVGAQLAACVNIHPPMTSVYVWQEKREETSEIAVFIKTRRSLIKECVDAARPLHPYTLPCFMVLPIIGGNEDYLTWACNQTKPL
jgi:periplasmic divalent cation tolerance protein